MFGNPAYECISVLMLQMNAYWFRDTISQLTLQQQSSYNNLNVKQKTLHVSYWFFFSKWDLQIVLSHWDGSAGSRCIKSDACHSDVKKYMSQQLPSQPQPKVPQGQGFSHGVARERAMIHSGGARAWTQLSLIAGLSSPRYSWVTLCPE